MGRRMVLDLDAFVWFGHFYAFLVLVPSNVGVLISTNKYIKHILER